MQGQGEMICVCDTTEGESKLTGAVKEEARKKRGKGEERGGKKGEGERRRKCVAPRKWISGEEKEKAHFSILCVC